MGRWSHLDSDDERLPTGMTRIGYDADSQTYTYRDSDGSTWEGPPGHRYGSLSKVGAPPRPSRAMTYTAPTVSKSWDGEKTWGYGDGKNSLDDDSSDDSDTLAEKVDLAQPSPTELTSEKPRTKPTPKALLATKPLPPLPHAVTSEKHEDSSDEYSVVLDAKASPTTPAPKGEEHRHKRREIRNDERQKLQRRGTISKITNYLRRNSSTRESNQSNGSESKGFGRSATGHEAGEMKNGRKREVTFDEILTPPGRSKK